MNTVPSGTLQVRRIRSTTVVLPEPVRPTSPTLSPAWMVKDTSRRASNSPSG